MNINDILNTQLCEHLDKHKQKDIVISIDINKVSSNVVVDTPNKLKLHKEIFTTQQECCLLAMGIITKWYSSRPSDISETQKYVAYELIRQTGVSQESAHKHVNGAFNALGWI